MGIDISRLSPQAQNEIYRQKIARDRQSKYGNQKTPRVMPNGETLNFDSKKEAERFDILSMLFKTGNIRKLRLQEQFTLQESYIDSNGDRVLAIKYKADFTYERPTEPDSSGQVHWIKVVEDVKGRRTKEYIMKKKLMRERFGIAIKEV